MYEDYKVENGVLVPAGEVRESYDALAYEGQGIVTEFAKLREGYETDVVRFARRWGLLEWAPYGNMLLIPRGDKLSLFWVHARDVRSALELRKYLQEVGDTGSEHPFEPSGGAGRVGHQGRTLTQSAMELISNLGRLPEERRILGIEGTIASLITPKLDWMKDEVVPAPLRRQPFCPSLLAAIYSHLADIVTRGQQLIRCEVCGDLFVIKDRRQRYCPPLPFQKGRTGSLCGARARKRQERHRKRQEPQSKGG